MSDLFFIYFCIHICIHYSLMAFMKCEGAFSNIVFQKIICHKSHIYDLWVCNSAGHGCRCFLKYYAPENYLPQEQHLWFLCLSILIVWMCFLRKTRKIEKNSEKFSKKKKLRGHFFCRHWKFPKSYCKFLQ